MEYFTRLRDLLAKEREEDRKSYLTITNSLSPNERRAAGLTWYPVAIKGTEVSRGDYLTVEVERTTHLEVFHQLRFGSSVVLFSNHDPITDRLEGVVSFCSGNRLKITTRTDDLPDWTSEGKLGVDLSFDENSYEEMFGALRSAAARQEKVGEDHLIAVLTGQEVPLFEQVMPQDHVTFLNQSQQLAIEKILSAQDLAIVHGPPGTGKTTTLVHAIKALVRQDQERILVVAPSNTAVDLLSEKLSEEGLNVLRVGNPVRVSPRLSSLTLDSKIAAHSSAREIKRLKKQASQFRDMAHKYKRYFGKAEREQRKALLLEARNVMKAVDQLEQYIVEDSLSKAQVIAATLVGANHYTVRHLTYKTVVIDEAGQALEPASWIAILKARKVVLAGDHFQLAPTVKSREAVRNGLNSTLLEKNIEQHPNVVVLLEEQYRMNEMIMGYSAGVFYQDKLKAHPSVANRLLFAEDVPLVFVDTAGCGFEEKKEGMSTSNPEEAAFLFKHLASLTQTLEQYYEAKDFPTVAIISPYKQQIYALQEQGNHSPVLQKYGDKISVNTIDSFQGQERDIVYISMTRSNPEGDIGFLTDIRRMNVALTRARKKLVVIGDSATLSQMPFYAGFIAYAEKRNAYRSAWEYINI